MLTDAQLAPLQTMAPAQRVAFAAGCAERVYDPYVLVAKPPNSRFAKTLDLLWAATEGAPPRAEDASQLSDFLRARLEALSGEQGVEYGALGALYHALQASVDGTPGSAAKAARYASGVAGRSNRAGDEAEAEEDAWQREWLAWCAQNDPSAAHAEFNVRNEARPEWLVRMES